MLLKAFLVVVLLFGLPNVYATSYAKLHLDLVGGTIKEGYNVTFSGMLTTPNGTPIPHRTIFIEDDESYELPNVILAITTTNSDGKFLTYWKAVPKDNDNPFYFHALFLGGKVFGYTNSESYESIMVLSNQSSTVVQSKTIPLWFKDASKLWHDGQIRDVDYSYGLENLIATGIIKLNGTDSISYMPSWLRNDAGWLSSGKISNDEFVNSLEYLIINKIVK